MHSISGFRRPAALLERMRKLEALLAGCDIDSITGLFAEGPAYRGVTEVAVIRQQCGQAVEVARMDDGLRTPLLSA